MLSRRDFVKGVAAAGVLSATGSAIGQGAWPAKPVRVINPFPAGGGTDAFLRPVAARLTQLMGRISQIENPLVARASIGIWKFFSDLDLSEAKKQQFDSLHDCFTRELKPGLRPFDAAPATVCSPSVRQRAKTRASCPSYRIGHPNIWDGYLIMDA